MFLLLHLLSSWSFVDWSPSGDRFDWQQTLAAVIYHRRTNGKTCCSQHILAKALKQHLQKTWIRSTDWHPSSLTLWHGNEVFKLSPPVSALFFISLWLGDASHQVCLPKRLNKTHRTQVKLIKAHLYTTHQFGADLGHMMFSLEICNSLITHQCHFIHQI